MALPFPISALLALLLACQAPSPAPQASKPENIKREAQKKAVEAERLVGRGEWKQAQALAKEAVAADPQSAEAHYVLGLSYEAGGELEAAESEYKKMGLLAPESLLEVSLARLYLRQGRLAEAEQQARRSVEKNRWVPQTHLSLGAVAMRKRDYPAAIAAFSNAVEAEPRDWNARLSLADAYRQAGRWDEALTQYAQAQALDPENPAALLGRAQTWEQMGRAAEAIEAYEKALEVAPSVAARLRLARLYLAVSDPVLQKPRRAVELAAAAAEATGWKNAAVLETLAEAYARSGDPLRARQVREQLKSLPASR